MWHECGMGMIHGHGMTRLLFLFFCLRDPIAGGKHLEKLTKDFKSYTSIILNKNKLDENWYNYIKIKCKPYLKIWSPYTFINNRYLKSLILRLGIRFNSVRARSIYLNNMRCEAHNDLSKAILDNKLKND